MPLLKSKSKKAFSHNVSEMMHHGHPQAQSLAAAYATQRKAQHKAYGGQMHEESLPHMAHGGHVDPYSKEERHGSEIEGPAQGEMGMAKGGWLNYEPVKPTGIHHPVPTDEEGKYHGEKTSGGMSHAGSAVRTAKRGYQDEAGKAAAYGEAKEMHKKKLGELQSMPSPKLMAYGGRIGTEYQSPCSSDCNDPCEVHEQGEYMSGEWNKSHPMHADSAAMSESARGLNQHGEDEQGPYGMSMAEGGMLTDDGYQTAAHEMDMVGRIMAKRQQHFSKGGQVANETERMEHRYDPNDFDDLVLRDSDMEGADYTGANSGDEKDNADQNKLRNDRVMRIMMKRYAQRNPGVYKGQVKPG